MARHTLGRRRGLATATGAAAAAALLTVGFGSATAADATDEDAVDVTLAEKNDSGITGTASYGADTVTATASGMDPDADYYSFVYGTGSSATGDNPCIVTGSELAGPILTVGEWDVDEDGNGTLTADAPVPADRAGTLSIREDDLGVGGSLGPLPVNDLVACGQIGDRQTTLLGAAQDQLPPVKVPSTPSGDDN